METVKNIVLTIVFSFLGALAAVWIVYRNSPSEYQCRCTCEESGINTQVLNELKLIKEKFRNEGTNVIVHPAKPASYGRYQLSTWSQTIDGKVYYGYVIIDTVDGTIKEKKSLPIVSLKRIKLQR